MPGQTIEVRTEPTADGYVQTRIARAGDAIETVAVEATPPLDVAALFAAPAA